MSTGSDKSSGSGPATPSTPTRHPKPRLLTISSDTTYISLTASASASSGVSGGSMTRSESSDATSQGIRSTYDMFVQQQGSSFARDIESLIRAEEESRATRHTAPREELRAGLPVCDQFLVLGAEQHRAPPLAMITFRSGIDPSPEHSDPAIYHPKVLFRYPPDASDDVAGLTYFCFPDGAVPQKFIRKKDAKDRKGSRFSFKLFPTANSPVQVPQNQSQLVLSRDSQSLNVDYIVGPEPEPFRFTQGGGGGSRRRPSILGGGGSSANSKGKKLISYHYEPENSFVFLISGNGGTDTRYGICVYKETIVYQTDQFFCVEPLCYCLITSVPFLTFDINALVSILDFPRISEALTLPPEKVKQFIAEAEASLNGLNDTKEEKDESDGNDKEKDVSNNENVDNNGINDDESEKDEKSKKDININKDSDKKDININKEINKKEININKEIDKKEIKIVEDPVAIAYRRAFRGVVEFMKLRVPDIKRPLKYSPETRKAPFEMLRPSCEEERQLLEEFGGSVLFHILPVKTILQLLCAFLLEYKVVVVSPNKRLLSTVVISLLPLIRPFTYPSSVIPVLPLSLLTYLEAPVPLLVGLTRQPHAESSEGFFIVNLHTTLVQCTKPLPPLPKQQKLYYLHIYIITTYYTLLFLIYINNA